jgi:hypothetical protein
MPESQMPGSGSRRNGGKRWLCRVQRESLIMRFETVDVHPVFA